MSSSGKIAAARIVCDTNVLLSAYLFRSGTLAWLREFIDARACTLVFDSHTAVELPRVLAYEKFALTKSQSDSVLLRIMLHAEVHSDSGANRPRRMPKCRDANDQMFIDLAYSAEVEALVSGDKDLLALSTASAVPILTPQQFRTRVSD